VDPTTIYARGPPDRENNGSRVIRLHRGFMGPPQDHILAPGNFIIAWSIKLDGTFTRPRRDYAEAERQVGLGILSYTMDLFIGSRY